LDTIFDIAVIGAGPAGAMAAYTAAKAGLRCALIEKEALPRYKICGGGLVGRGVACVPFDLSSVIHGEFRTIEVYSNGYKHRSQAQSSQPIISMVMRDEFDAYLVKQAVSQGAVLFASTALQGLEFGDEIHILRTSQGPLRARAIIAADGATSPTAKLAGWAQDTRVSIPALEYEVQPSAATFTRLAQSVRFDMDAFGQGYGWSFPKAEHLSLGVGAMKKGGKLELKPSYAAYARELGIEEASQQSQHGYVIPVAPRTDGFVKNRVFLAGDAAGLADPLTAEGISNALASGIWAAQALIDAGMDCSRAKEAYEQKLQTEIVAQHQVAGQLAHWFYSNLTARNLLLRHFGDAFADRLAQIFMGKSRYPADLMASLQRRVKSLVMG
jgi:geranylgeranyl reductase family protein